MVAGTKNTLALLFYLVLFSCNTNVKDKKIHVDVFPKTTNNVIDYSELLLAKQVKLLEERIDSFENKTTNQIVIVIQDSVPYDISKYTTDLASKWEIGQKHKDNGLVLLVAKNQRKIRISTGYGTEKTLTDSICNQILIEELAPNFREQKYYKGLNDALSKIFFKWHKNE